MMNNLTLERLDSTFNVVQQLISDLPEEILDRILQGYKGDVDNLINDLIIDTHACLFGNQKAPVSLGYIDKLADKLEENLRVANFNYFVTSVLKELDVSWHHLEWGDVIQRYQSFCIIAARDHGKSYWFSNAYPIWKLYRYLPKGPMVPFDRSLSYLGYLFSFTTAQAKDLLQIIKDTIEGNDIVKERLLPDRFKDGWSKTEIVCKNGAKLRVKGMGQSVRGAHPGWIMVDDPQKDNIIFSKLQREKLIEYFHGTIENMLVPGGQLGIVGTPFHLQDLYGDLKQKGEEYHIREYPGIFPNGQLLWPQRHSIQSLIAKKKKQGSLVFSREILCKPISSDSTIFPYDIISRAIYHTEHLKLVNERDNFEMKDIKRVSVGCDFARSANVGSDYSVFTVWAVDSRNVRYLMYMWRAKGKSFGEQMNQLRWINRNFRPDVMFLEANQFQEIFASESLKEGMPVYAHTTTKANKNDFTTGLPGLAIAFENNSIKFPYGDQASKETADLIFSELMSIAFTDKGLQSTSDHDDTAMSIWLGNLAANYQGNKFFFDFV